MSNRDLVVNSDSRLDLFLVHQKILAWRIPILVKYGGIKVLRGTGKQSVALDKGPRSRLEGGDIVRLLDPLPTACAQALQKAADTEWRDYAIVPGTTSFDALMLKFMQARTRTVVITDAFMQSLDGFIKGLASSMDVIYPIRHLIVVGHASFTGQFKIVIDGLPKQQEFVHYEDLELAVAKKFMIVDMSVLMPRPKGEGVAQIRLLGCNIGAQAPYMRKMKEALGNQIKVVAPTRLVLPDTVAKPLGPSAYLGYDFAINRPVQLKDHAAVVQEMIAESKKKRVRNENLFVLENGKLVTATDITKWVLKRPNEKPFAVLGKQVQKQPHVDLMNVRVPVFGTGKAKVRFIYNKQSRLFNDGFPPLLLKKDTGKVEDRKKLVKDFLQRNDRRFSDAHPLPLYVRLGYESMDEFMDGWDWRFAYDKAKGVLTADPVRDQYTLWKPITSVATNELIMNYYPDAKTNVPGKFRGRVPFERLNVSDLRFFRSY